MKQERIKRLLSLLLCVVMVLTMMPVTVLAYVGAMVRNPGSVTSGVETVDGRPLHYLRNDYIGFYINPDGHMMTLPSQKGAKDAAKMGFTETNLFYKQYSDDKDNWRTDYSKPFHPNAIVLSIDETDSNNPKLKQTLQLPLDNLRVEITYEIVKLDRGAHDTLTDAAIIGKDSGDDGKTWGIMARAKLSEWENDKGYRLSWVTEHDNFGSVAHNIAPNIRINRHSPNGKGKWFYSSGLHSGGGYMDAQNVNEVYTDSFAYANQFVAFSGYVDSAGWSADGGTLYAGIEGHLQDDGAMYYGAEMKYDGDLYVSHESLSSLGYSRALWGFRDLYPTTPGWNPPPDPVDIPATARCVGIVSSGSGLKAEAGLDEAELRQKFGANLLNVFRGDFDKQQSGDFVFKSGSLQLAPSMTASWSGGSAGIVITKNGEIKATGVGLSTPTFKFYSPLNSSNDTSLKFGFDGNKLKIDINPANNTATLHIDIPGAVCRVESVTTADNGGIVFEGEMSISTPLYDAVNIDMKRLGMGMKNGSFGMNGVEASGSIDMSQLLGMKAASVTGEINTFPGTERYKFEMELDVYDMFEAEGELELKRIQNGALIPNTLKMKAASDVGGIPLVPPVVVAELNGLGGGFSGLADTIKGDLFAIPPLKLSLTGKVTVAKTFEGWGEVTVGPGYYASAIKDAEILDMDVLEEFSWYEELSGETRSYNGRDYTGLKVGGGMKVDLALMKDLPFIKAGGEVNAFAFAGLDNITNPQNVYVIMDADGKIYGKVQIPAEAWFINRDLVLANKEVDFALGGQTVVPVKSVGLSSDFKETMNRVGDSAKDALKNASAYGGVAYTGKLIGFPFRIYYIFQDRKPGIKIGSWLGSLDPFNPRPDTFRITNTAALLSEETGEQVGIMVLGDNMTVLDANTGDDRGDSLFGDVSITTTWNDADTVTDAVYGGSPLATPTDVEQNDAKDKGVTITGSSERSYSVNIDSTAPDTKYLAFLLKPKSGTAEDFLGTVNVQKDSASISLVPAAYDAEGQITNEGEANVIIGEDRLMLKLPTVGNYVISSASADFDIACVYASPFASFDGMSLSGSSLAGAVKDRAAGTEYIRRTYLGTEEGGTDYLLSQSDVTSDSISETLELSGTIAPTGNYYVTTILFEKHKEDFDGDGTTGAEEFAYVTTDTYEFDNTVSYTNTVQPNEPQSVGLESIGSELMRAEWKAPASGDADGYNILLYQEDGGKYIPTRAVYQLKSSELAAGTDGLYSYDMAVTVGDKSNRLEADKQYKIGITAFKYLADGNEDGTNDSLPVESAEVQSEGKLLPKATYPVLSYSPPFSGDGMKILPVSGKTIIAINSDVKANIVVTRMDNNEEIIRISASGVTFDTPSDFTGALNLKITATDAEGDTTVDYIGLRLNDAPPPITLDSELFKADRNDGRFTITGITESGTKVAASVLSDFTGVSLDKAEVVADGNGVFRIDGMLNSQALSPVDGAFLELKAENAAGKSSDAFAQVVRAEVGDTGTDTSGGDGDGRSSIIRYTSSITTDKQPNMPTIAKMSVSGTVKGSVLSATITEQMTKDAIKAAQDAAKQSGKAVDGIAVEFTATGSGTWHSLIANVEAGAIDRLKEAGVKFIKIGSAVLDVTLDTGAIAEIDKQSTGMVTVSATKRTKLSKAAKALIGSRPAFDITVGYQKNDKTEYITSFGKGMVTLGIAYKAIDNEKAGNLFGVYVDRNGKPQLLTNSSYDNSRLIFSRNSLSTYGVGYKAPAPAFTDTAKHWAKDDIDFVVSRDLISGTSATTFAPNTAITRADFLMALGRLSGADVSIYKASNFTDIKATDPAMPYIEWGVKNKIVSGYGNGKFGPNDPLTREQMAVMMVNYAKTTGYKLPVSRQAITFADDAKISAYAKDAVKAIQQTGVINGKDNNLFDPQGNATRAEASTILRRFVELVIDEGTARDWNQNDAGQWQYIGENGKAVTVWLTAEDAKYYFTKDGIMVSGKWLQLDGKWYYFYADGSLAVNTKVDGYEVDENGVRKNK